MIVSGFERGCSADHVNLVVYCWATGLRLETDATKSKLCHFDIGPEMSQGFAIVELLLDSILLKFEVQFVSADAKTLLGLPPMENLGI